MTQKIGFSTEKYLKAQIAKIEQRVGLFDKLYLEFGGKLRWDNHASRVLPGYALDTKIQMLQRLKGQIEIVHCISAKDIEARKIRGDSRLPTRTRYSRTLASSLSSGYPSPLSSSTASAASGAPRSSSSASRTGGTASSSATRYQTT